MTEVTSTLSDRLAGIHRRIENACREAGRDPSEVRLLPVSKTHPVETIREAYAAGERSFGENKVQEAQAKAAELADLDIRWSVIGHLQSNKVNHLLRFAHEFQALDSLRLAEALDRRLQAAGRSLDVFLQVNSSAEPQKFGIPVDEVESVAERLGAYASLNVRGLMTMAMFSDDRDAVSACFARTAALRERLRNNDRAPGDWGELSMGMSGDFELAIAQGATVVRVGTAVFGARDYAEAD